MSRVGAGRHAGEPAIEIGKGVPRADLDDPVLAGHRVDGAAVHLPVDVEGDPVALPGFAGYLPPVPPPLSKGLDHLVDVGLAHLRGGSTDLDGLEVFEPDLGEHLEHGGVLEARPRRALDQIDARFASGSEFLAHERVGEALAHEVTHDLVADRRAEPPGHDLHRRLAGAEPRDPRGPHQVVEPLADLLLDSLLGQLDRQPALETGRGLYRDLHVFTSVPRTGGVVA